MEHFLSNVATCLIFTQLNLNKTKYHEMSIILKSFTKDL